MPAGQKSVLALLVELADVAATIEAKVEKLEQAVEEGKAQDYIDLLTKHIQGWREREKAISTLLDRLCTQQPQPPLPTG